MAKDKSFLNAKLILDEPRSIYYAGQVIHGQIEYELAKPVTFTAINVNFIGECIVYWTETESEEYNGVKRNKQVEYKSREEYFNVTQCLYEGRTTNSLSAGVHNLEFKYQIPHNVPSTFKSKCGNITYTVIAYIDYADARKDREKISKEFEVVAPMNLDTEEGKRPIFLEFEEVYSCCCSSTPMNVGIHIPMTGFVPGQAIPITIDAKNESNIEVKKIIFQLIKRVAFRSHQPTSEFTPPEEILKTLKTGPILANTTREIYYEMVVPDEIAINLDNCEYIDLGYGLKVIIKLSGCNDDLEDSTEIILGVVPIPGSPGADGYKHPMAHNLPISPLPKPPPVSEKANVSPQIASHPPSNVGFQTASPPPYPSNPAPYPTNPAPYPTNPAPYPTNPAPYPTNPAPYPTNPAPYPSHPAPYAPSPYPSAMPHPHETIPLNKMSPGFPMPAPYPTHNTAYSPGTYPGNPGTPSAPPP